MTDPAAWQRWFDAARRDDVDAALRTLYQTIDADITGRNPTCWLSGKCCHFETYGHQLWVTALEVAWALNESGARLGTNHQHVDGCPFQVDKLCTAHALRPLGCRIFFCDPNAQSWQDAVYEQHLGALRDLHTHFAIEYRYLEWRAGLDEAVAAQPV